MKRPEVGALSLNGLLAGLVVLLLTAGIVAALVADDGDGTAAPTPVATTLPPGTGVPGTTPLDTSPVPRVAEPTTTLVQPGTGATPPSSTAAPGAGGQPRSDTGTGTGPGSGLGAEGPGEVAAGRAPIPNTGGPSFLLAGSILLGAGMAVGRLRRRAIASDGDSEAAAAAQGRRP